MAARLLFAGGNGLNINSSVSSFLPNCILTNCTNGFCLYDTCFILPPPPPADQFPVDVHHKNRLLSTFLISAASLLAFSFLFLLLLYFLLRLRRRRRQQQQQPLPPPPPLNNDDDDLLEINGDTPHHVWLIRTVGLDESIIKSIAAAVYKAGDGLVDAGDCTVCLGEFVDGEVVKILPKCSHAFHLPCIDTWLRSHVTCPLCRAPVAAPPPPPLQIEIQEQESAVVVNDVEAGSSSSSSSNSANSAEDESEEVQPIRRSVSMDSSSLGMLMLRVESEQEEEEKEKLEEEEKQVELQRAVRALNCSINKGKWVNCLGKHPGAVEMKRSLSSRSGRMFFSRYRRGRSTSVLPL